LLGHSTLPEKAGGRIVLGGLHRRCKKWAFHLRAPDVRFSPGPSFPTAAPAPRKRALPVVAVADCVWIPRQGLGRDAAVRVLFAKRIRLPYEPSWSLRTKIMQISAGRRPRDIRSGCSYQNLPGTASAETSGSSHSQREPSPTDIEATAYCTLRQSVAADRSFDLLLHCQSR